MKQVEIKSLAAALDVLCPMHLLIGSSGDILFVGSTLAGLVGADYVGRPVGDLVEIKKPIAGVGFSKFVQISGQRVSVSVTGIADYSLVGVLMPLDGGYVLNLSFGVRSVDAAQNLKLSLSNFAPTDPTVAMIYLSEVKSSAIEEFQRLSARLSGEKSKAVKEASTDALTGLLNFRALRDEMVSLLQVGSKFAVMMIDLDFFKAVNDTLGHLAGDHVLKVMAEILKDETRKGDIVARNGGDEFTVLLKDLDDPDQVSKIAGRIIERISTPIAYGDTTCHVSASIGTMLSNTAEDLKIEAILDSVDSALYQSKRTGRGRNTVHTTQ